MEANDIQQELPCRSSPIELLGRRRSGQLLATIDDRLCGAAGDILPLLGAGLVLHTDYGAMSICSCSPDGGSPWTALCWRESWRLNCWQLSGSRISRNWPPKLPQTGTCPPRRCKADWKRCAPIWSWCRATLPCCMK